MASTDIFFTTSETLNWVHAYNDRINIEYKGLTLGLHSGQLDDLLGVLHYLKAHQGEDITITRRGDGLNLYTPEGGFAPLVEVNA